ncbi:MAG: HigA family addiction module antidote protein [Gammaproteobacteria bacterium]|nr:HigA family addiction module antidote protein [Gammaproteobacteria bacterium]
MNKISESGVIGVDVHTIKSWIDQDDVVLVDVRETSEYDKEHIPGAMLLPMSKFDAEIFPKVLGKKVVLHCAVGKRSESAGKMLIDEGYLETVHMIGGIEAWKASGFATEVQITPPPSPSELKNQEPQFLCPTPGEVLRDEYMTPLSISNAELAGCIGVTEKDIEQLTQGESKVDVVLSLRLARYFSTAADFWVHLQIERDLEEARHEIGHTIREEISPRATASN